MSLSIKVNQWTIKPKINRIIGPSGTQNVGPRVMRLLLELINHPGEVRTREELLAMVWDDVIVNEESLTKSISFLRTYFRENDIQYIETIRSVGYRWIGPEPKYVQADRSPHQHKLTPLLRWGNQYRVAIGLSMTMLLILVLFPGIIPRNFSEPHLISLTNDKNQERVPRISPDGKQVLYATPTPTGGGMDVYVKDIATNETQRLTTSYTLDTDPLWSPDGSKVVFYKNNSEDVSIQEIDLESDKQRKLVDVHEIPNLSAITWSPDGQFIIYCDRISAEDRWSLYRLELSSGKVERLTSPQDEFYGDVSPRYSDDGKKLAFIRIRERGMLYKHLIPGWGDVYVMDLNTDEVKEVYKSDMEVSGVEWLENSNHLAIIRVNNYFTFEITCLDLQTGSSEAVYSSQKLLRNLSKAPKNNDLVFEEWSERYSVWKANLNEDGQLENYRPYLDIADKSWHPQTSHSGRWLSYISTRSGHNQLWLHDIENKTDTQLTYIDVGVIRNPRWSPDDSKILFEHYNQSNFDLMIADVPSGKVSPVAATARQERNAAWALDGKSVYFALRKDDQFNICQLNLSTGDEEMITNEGAFAVKTSELGIFYYSLKDWSIHHLDSDGNHRMIVDDLSAAEWFNWEVIDNHIYYVKRGPGWRPHLYRYNISNGVKTDISNNNLNFSHVYQGFSIDPVSGVIYATVNDYTQSDIKMLAGI